MISELLLSPLQIAESASLSLAMVARHALGSYADSGKVSVFASDSLAGLVVMAGARHLMSAGADLRIIVLETTSTPTELFTEQLESAKRFGVTVDTWQKSGEGSRFEECLSQSHSVIWGASGTDTVSFISEVCDLLSEMTTPVHCVEAPLGVDLDSGELGKPRIYAASTLSLGAPLNGLHRGREVVGRHYLCDISIPPALYAAEELDYSQAFSEQPVVQIYPVD